MSDEFNTPGEQENPADGPQKVVPFQSPPPMTAPPDSPRPRHALSREGIFRVADVLSEFVYTPEWAAPDASPEEKADCGVWVHGMTARERDTFETDQLEFGKRVKTRVEFFHNFRATLVARCTFDADGSRLFGETDVAWLGNKAAAVVSRLSDKIRDLSGMTSEDVEELAKKSGADESDSSPSDLPPLSVT